MQLLSPERAEILVEQQAALYRQQFDPDVCERVAQLIGQRLAKQFTATAQAMTHTEGVHSSEMELHKLRSEWVDIDRLVRRTFSFAHGVVALPQNWGDRRKFWPAARGHIMEPNAKIGVHTSKAGLQGVAMLVGLAGSVEVDIFPVTDEQIDLSGPEKMVTTQLGVGDVLIIDVEQRPPYQETNTGVIPSTHMIVFERPTSS